MRRLGRLVGRHRRAVLIVTGILVIAAGAYGAKVKDHLTAGGFVTDGSASVRAEAEQERLFHTGTPNILLLVTVKQGTVDASLVEQRGLALTERLRKEPGIAEALSYWSVGGAAPLRGEGGKQALILLRVRGEEDAVANVTASLHPRYTSEDDVWSVRFGGPGEIFREITEQAEKDLQRAEGLSMPVTLILLLLIFGSAVAAGLPLAIGIIAILFTFAVLRLLAMLTDVSIFSLNLTTGMGLGLAVDYSLFIVSRYREELAKDDDEHSALLRTMHTAGRTVAFSAVSVAIALATLLIFPLPFLRSFAYAGVAVVAVAGIASIVVLPAALAALGHRVNKWSIRKPKPQPEKGFWYHQAHRVMRHPVLVTVGVAIVLILLGLPALNLNLGLSDDRVLHEDTPVRRVHDDLRANFETSEAGAISVVAPDVAPGAGRRALVDGYAARLSQIDGVGRVDAKTGFYSRGRLVAPPNQLSARFASTRAAWFNVVPSIEPFSTAGEDLVKQVRATKAPFPVLVGGLTAKLVDTKATLFARLPIALVLINVATFVLMFLMVGSLLVPLKSIILNIFSLTATFGALVLIFQDGHLEGLLGFTHTGSIAVYIPIALFCIAFGLSQDYEVFLLSRVKEHYDLTRDNDEAVAVGLQLSGRIITALAILLIVVFAAFVTGEVAVVKLFGVGLALAIVVDAFIIRVTLAPALMRIAGHLNWWAPRSLRRLHLRFGIWESDSLDVFDTADKDTRAVASRLAAADGEPRAPRSRATKAKAPARKTTATKPAARKKAPRASAAKPRATRKS
jgi:RND superfamily putative drug exporter